MISDRPSDTSARQRSRMPARSGCRRSTNRWPPRLRCQPSTGKPRQRLLGDDPQLVRQRREDHRRVVDALVIRHEDVGRARRDALEPFDRDAHAGRLQNQPRPRARAAVREVAAPIEQAGHNRRGAEHDRVDGDGGDQKEDGPPPVERGNAQVRKDNLNHFPGNQHGARTVTTSVCRSLSRRTDSSAATAGVVPVPPDRPLAHRHHGCVPPGRSALGRCNQPRKDVE